MSVENDCKLDGSQKGNSLPQNGPWNHEDLLRKIPTSPGFLVSFLVDARGGTMYGRRHSGVDIVIPQSKVCMPTRLTCRLLKKEKVNNLPQLGEEEAFASRILELGPVGKEFIGLVLIELPHFASKIGQDRELIILKSDDGRVWNQHDVSAPAEKIDKTLFSSNKDQTGDKKLVAKIYTSYFPKYFVAVSKAKEEWKIFDHKSGALQCATSSIKIPAGAINRETKITLEVLPVTKEMIQDTLRTDLESSYIVSIKPLRRRFHQSICVAISIRKELQEKIRSYKKGSQNPPALLLYSISGGSSPAVWEDITASAPYSLSKDTVTFSTSVSARYWLLENNKATDVLRDAKTLYNEAIAVPFYACFYVLAKKHSNSEVQVRILCMNDGDIKQTLEHEEHFVHLATSNYVEVVNGKSYNLEVTGNMIPSAASPGQLFLIFHAFRVNRFSFVARVQDLMKSLSCQISIFKNTLNITAATNKPICTFDISLQNLDSSPTVMTPEAEKKWIEVYQKVKENFASQDNINKAPELKLLDIADQLKSDWVALAGQLGITSKEVVKLQTEYGNINEQAILMLHLWVDKMRNQAKASQLEAALMRIGREDIIESCIRKTDSKNLFDEPVQPIDDSYHEDVSHPITNGSEVQEGVVYEVEDVWDGTKWHKTKKMIPTLVEDPIQSTEIAEGPLFVATKSEFGNDGSNVIKECEEVKETLEDGTVVRKKMSRETAVSDVTKRTIPSLQITKVEDGLENVDHETSIEETEEVLEDGIAVKVTKIKSAKVKNESSN